MNLSLTKPISLDEFLKRPEDRCELVNGTLKPKVSPKFKHAQTQGYLYRLLHNWCEEQQIGQVLPEWGIILKRNDTDWVPIPDLIYVSYQRLAAEWDEDAMCPVIPELVIEIISPGQTFGELTEKAENYMKNGIDRVWIVDPQAQTVTVFRKDEGFHTLTKEQSLTDPLFPELELSITDLFARKKG